MVQEDKNIHLTGVSDLAPSYFLMDGVAYSGATEQVSAVVLNDGDKNVRTTKISVTLRRAAVKVVVNGKKELVSIKLDPDAVDPDDVETLEDLILAAVNEGVKKAEEVMSERMGAITGGLNIPGLF